MYGYLRLIWHVYFLLLLRFSERHRFLAVVRSFQSQHQRSAGLSVLRFMAKTLNLAERDTVRRHKRGCSPV